MSGVLNDELRDVAVCALEEGLTVRWDQNGGYLRMEVPGSNQGWDVINRDGWLVVQARLEGMAWAALFLEGKGEG